MKPLTNHIDDFLNFIKSNYTKNKKGEYKFHVIENPKDKSRYKIALPSGEVFIEHWIVDEAEELGLINRTPYGFFSYRPDPES